MGATLEKLLRVFSTFSLSPRWSTCKCTYGSSCWPDANTFSSLSAHLSEPLVYPCPPESACYPADAPSANCAAVLTGTFDGNWRANQSGSMQSPNFETYIHPDSTVIEACYLNASLGVPCQQGSVPVVGVDARTVEDIIEAVKFAGANNLKVAIKNTGHDFLGRSTARGSFLIWTHNMKDITYNDSFSPLGAPSGETYNTITLGAGVQWHEAYSAAAVQGVILVGGLSTDGSVVAAGGWVLGGGHSALSPSYGLGVDSVLQFAVVTSTGAYLNVSSYSYPDLFWALRGGGGGTFGVVVSVTYQTHPSIPVVASVFSANTTNTTTFAKLLSEYVRISPELVDQGWGGYGDIINGSLQFLHVAPNVSLSSANDAYASFFDFARALSDEGLNVQTTSTLSYSTYYEWYKTWFTAGQPVGVNVLLGSRLLPRDVVESNYTKIGEALAEDFGWVQWVLVAGGAVSKVEPDAMGVNPAWRTALAEVLTAVSWPEGSNVSVISGWKDVLKQKISILEDLAPGSGAYLNEDSLNEENWQRLFFGSHYSQLKVIKDRYDPARMFVVVEGVGSEDWDEDLTCIREHQST
ncbi:FAD-binding domain-containing protein [Neolentinus lepideus HHB14362 ss-1]|uniref:FAD-binding domain-containing protein n=1 Tax=Neolentinus lepideus HHB14362 ss-1 TaxID=1314782 RepID=A0A165W2V4_9AGAM|nr:FAD-binding domain-containing protein [Neolentinus lepideus HHB14362 ss-1]